MGTVPTAFVSPDKMRLRTILSGILATGGFHCLVNKDLARPIVGARPLEENQSKGENSWPWEVTHESVCVQECVLYLCFSKQFLLIYSQV